jgi:hypothetical protein
VSIGFKPDRLLMAGIAAGPVRPRFETVCVPRHARRFWNLKPGGDITSHAGYVVIELRVSAQVANDEIFEKPTAEPFLGWW